MVLHINYGNFNGLSKFSLSGEDLLGRLNGAVVGASSGLAIPNSDF